jgi:hypothetical protein
MTVGKLLREISSSELTEWMAYRDIKNNPPDEIKENTGKLKSMFAHLVVKNKVK